ncbi:MAG: ABC transporter permease [Actinomycetota bacterium]|nr:ABC transporter permease [Actinomycetota bacterium]
MSAGRSELSATRAVREVAGREIRERLRAKSYLALTGLLVVIIIGIGIVGRIASGGEPGVEQVGVTEDLVEPLGTTLVRVGEAFDRELEVVPLDAGDVRTAVEDGDVGVALDGDAREIVFAEEADDQLAGLVQQTWADYQTRQGLADAGVGAEEADRILTPEPLAVVSIDDPDEEGLAILTGTIVSVLLFISLQTFGQYVLMGVVEEKSTAVVELLLARVRSDELLAGKVIGIGVAALLQFAAAMAAGLVSLAISGFDVPSDIWSTLPVAVVWFLGGYALYSTLFALAGSLVSRQEDAQAAAAPILTVLIGAYMTVFILGYEPDSTASTILSLVPPLAPFVMPVRMASGAASVVEVVASLVLLALTIVGAWRLAGKIFEQVLLRRGSRIGWKDAAALLRSR